MEDYARAFLTGVAIGGVSSVMFEANKFVLKRLWGVNCIAAKLAWDIINKVILKHPCNDDADCTSSFVCCNNCESTELKLKPKYTSPCLTTSS